MSEKPEQELYVKITGHAHSFDGFIAPQLNAITYGGDNTGSYVIFQAEVGQNLEVAKLSNFIGRKLKIIVIDGGHAGLVNKQGEEIESGTYSEELASLNARDRDWFF